VAEVPEQPPEPGGAARAAVVVGDDEDVLADPGPGRRGGERLCARQRVAALPLDYEVGEVVDAEERRTRDVGLEVRLPPGLDPIERVRAVDEQVRAQ
jgi:hypothetical protein